MHPQPGRILMVGPHSLGEVCRAVPVLASLRRECPAAQIDWVVQESVIGAVCAHPMLDSAIPCPRYLLQPIWNPAKLAMGFRWMNRTLRHTRYDRVVDVHGTALSRVFSWWARAAQRVRTPDMRGAPVRDAQLFVPADDLDRWREMRPRFGLHGRYAIFAPCTRWKSKQWPAERWRSLAAEVLNTGIEGIAFIGLRGEEDALRAAMPTQTAIRARCVDLCGRTSAGSLLAVVDGASLVVSNDSAALHVAVGLGRPCIGIFGPTDPYRSGFLGDVDWALQGHFAECEPPLNYRDRRLDDRLMRRVTVAAAAARVRAALAVSTRTAVSA